MDTEIGVCQGHEKQIPNACGIGLGTGWQVDFREVRILLAGSANREESAIGRDW